jgi:hypothetical protein
MSLQVHSNDRCVKGIHSQAQVIHVASFNRPGGGDEIHQGTSGTKLDETRLERFWGTAKDISVKSQHLVKVSAAKDYVVDFPDVDHRHASRK